MTFNEREAIRFYLKQIAEESRSLRQRLQELDERYAYYIERLRQLDGNEGEMTMVQPKKNKEDAGNLKNFNLEEMIEKLRRVQPEKKKHPLTPAPAEKSHNLKEAAVIMEEILKEHGKAMKISSVKEALANRGYRWNYFSSTLPQILKYTDKIYRPFRGYVQYHGEESSQTANSGETAASSDE